MVVVHQAEPGFAKDMFNAIRESIGVAGQILDSTLLRITYQVNEMKTLIISTFNCTFV